MGVEIKSPPGNGPYSFRIRGQIYYLVLLLYQEEANMTGCWQICILDLLKQQQNVLQTNQTKSPFAES
jgi:hypothetical protein